MNNTFCTGLNLKATGIWWHDMETNKYYCNYCYNKYNIQTIYNLNRIDNNFNFIYKYYCSSYLLKPVLKISLFNISLWSKDLNTSYEYNIESNKFIIPTNTEYIIFIDSQLADNQYYTVNCTIENIDIEDEKLILYKTTNLIKPNLIYIKKLSDTIYKYIKSYNEIKLNINIYNNSVFNIDTYKNTDLGIYELNNNELNLIESSIRIYTKHKHNSDINWNANYIFTKLDYNISININLDDTINNLEDLALLNNKYLATINTNELLKYEFKLKLNLYKLNSLNTDYINNLKTKEELNRKNIKYLNMIGKNIFFL